MSDLKMTLDGRNLELVNGDLAITIEDDAVRQHIQQRLRAFKGEWFLDLSNGVPYFQDILKKNPNPIVLDGVLKDAILSTPGVLELLSFDLNYINATRKLTLDFSVQVSQGVIDFEKLEL